MEVQKSQEDIDLEIARKNLEDKQRKAAEAAQQRRIALDLEIAARKAAVELKAKREREDYEAKVAMHEERRRKEREDEERARREQAAIDRNLEVQAEQLRLQEEERIRFICKSPCLSITNSAAGYKTPVLLLLSVSFKSNSPAVKL